ncbi:MAG TPA: M28 family peptidase, partial [Candidatus Acetothermia bacterium]|nr:M28 family peptidase [Candidatus Acetothermia bacterium]
LYPSLAFFVSALGVNLFGEGLRRLVKKGLLQLRRLVNRYTLVVLLMCALAFHFGQWETGSMLFYRRLASQFDSGRVMKQIETLTSPAFDERALGSQGMDQAADYIASQFSSCDLQAAGTNYTYFATHERTFESLDETPQLSIGDSAADLRYLRDYTVFAGMYRNVGKIEGEVVFLATGELTETVQGKVPALAGMDFSQDILLLPSPATANALEDLRVPIGGMLVIADDDSALNRRVTLSGQDRSFFLTLISNNAPPPDDYPKLLITKAVADRILASSGNSLRDLSDTAKALEKDEIVVVPTGVSSSMEIKATVHERMPVRDVIGYIPGTLAGEAISKQGLALDNHMIVVMAQYDSPPSSPDGTPFPGANDNASGVGIMLEAIRTMQESDYKPYKTFLFVAYSGEGSEGGNDVRKPDPSQFLRAAAFFSSSYKIEATIRLRGLGAGDGRGLALFSPGNLRLVHLFEDAAQRMGLRAQPVDDAMDMSVVFAGKTARDSGQESPDITLSWQGWERTSRTPSDTVDTISQTKIEKAGRALALALMILGRETNY